MSRRSPAPWVPWVLGVLMLTILLSVPARMSNVTSFPDPQIAIIMIGLVAFVTNVAVPLQGDAISLGYAAGLLVLLSQHVRGTDPIVYAVIAIGGFIGGLLRALWWTRERGFRPSRRLIEWPLMTAVQLASSMAVGGLVYQWMGGLFPFKMLDWSVVLPLTALIVVSIGTYLGLYAISLWWRGLHPREVFKDNRLIIGLAVTLPLPFVIAAAVILPQSSSASITLVVGLIALAIGATELGRGQLRYRQQVIELQSLSAVNRAMRTYLDLDALIQTIHLQVATLLDTPNFTLTLYDSTRNMLSFPLVIRQQQRLNWAPRELGMELIDHVVAKKAPLLITENPSLRTRAMGLVPPDGGISSWLGVPLMTSDRALGAIAVFLDDPYRHFSERDQRLLATIATQASIAIENAQLYRQVQDRAYQLNQLNALWSQLSSTLDPQRVLEMVAESTIKVAVASGAAIFLWWDDAKTSLALVRSAGLSAQFTSDTPMPLTTNKTMQPVVVQNVQIDARAKQLCNSMLREKVYSWVELPLYHGEEMLGVLVSYYPTPRQFTGDEIELLKTFANQAALSISNARRYRQTDEALDRRIEQLSALATINKELSSTLNLTHVFNLVLERAIEATRSSHGVLILRNEIQDEPRLVASRGNGKLKTNEIMVQPVVSQAYKTGQPTVVRNIDSPYGKLAQLGVPIARDYDVLGVIMLESSSTDAYHPDDVSFVSQLATQATIAIDNARIFEWMQDNRNRLQVILDSMHEAVILFDLEGKVALANPRVASLLGIEPSLIMGEKLSTLLERKNITFAERLGFDDETLAGLFELLKLSQWQGGGRLSYRLDNPTTRFIDRTIVAVLDDSQKTMGMLMVFADATEERQLAQAREDLSRMIVHDLRSPLTAINTSMKLLNEIAVKDDPVSRSVQKTVDVSQRALRKLLHLVDSLLDIAKMESGTIVLDKEPHNIQALAENVRIELSPLAEELDIRVEINVAKDVPNLMIDGNKMERVLLNLVDNALKFTPVAGLVQIQVRRQGENMVHVDVVDTGPGVPDEFKIRIFERFQQVDQGKGHRRGTGLGLTFCRLAIEAHGGKIWIEDNPQGGSIFAFTLPIE